MLAISVSIAGALCSNGSVHVGFNNWYVSACGSSVHVGISAIVGIRNVRCRGQFSRPSPKGSECGFAAKKRRTASERRTRMPGPIRMVLRPSLTSRALDHVPNRYEARRA